MKKLISLLLLCALLFSCAACTDPGAGTDSPAAGIEFNPQTPKEAFDLMLRVFQSQTAYRRICNTYPDHEESGSLSDLVFVGIGTDGQQFSGEIRNKKDKTFRSVYGEGNIAVSRSQDDVVKYLQKEAGDKIGLYEEAINSVSLKTETGDKAENLLSAMIGEMIDDQDTLLAQEDGSYLLTVTLSELETFSVYNIDFPKSPYNYVSEITYRIDGRGRILEVGQKEVGRDHRNLLLQYSYEDLPAVQKPDWFNGEDPLKTDRHSVSLTYEIDEVYTFTLKEKDGKTTVTVAAEKDSPSAVSVPSFLPTDVSYSRNASGVSYLIFEEYAETLTFEDPPGFVVLFKKGARPADNTDKRYYAFEGEWEMKAVEGGSVPVIKK